MAGDSPPPHIVALVDQARATAAHVTQHARQLRLLVDDNEAFGQLREYFTERPDRAASIAAWLILEAAGRDA